MRIAKKYLWGGPSPILLHQPESYPLAKALNKAGRYWNQFTDWFSTPTWGTALDEMGRPIMLANGETAKTYISPALTTSIAMASTLPIGAFEYGLLPTMTGLGASYLASRGGDYVGRNIARQMGGDLYAQDMFGDILGVTGGLVGFKPGVNFARNYRLANDSFNMSPRFKKRLSGIINNSTGQSRDVEGTAYIEALERQKARQSTQTETLEETISKMTPEEKAQFELRLKASAEYKLAEALREAARQGLTTTKTLPPAPAPQVKDLSELDFRSLLKKINLKLKERPESAYLLYNLARNYNASLKTLLDTLHRLYYDNTGTSPLTQDEILSMYNYLKKYKHTPFEIPTMKLIELYNRSQNNSTRSW